jgi:hypothetical protein
MTVSVAFRKTVDGGMISLQVHGLAQISVGPFSRYTMDN